MNLFVKMYFKSDSGKDNKHNCNKFTVNGAKHLNFIRGDSEGSFKGVLWKRSFRGRHSRESFREGHAKRLYDASFVVQMKCLSTFLLKNKNKTKQNNLTSSFKCNQS